jgi:hypothetical protein
LACYEGNVFSIGWKRGNLDGDTAYITGNVPWAGVVKSLIAKFYKGLLWWLGSRLGALDSSYRCLLDLEGEIKF